MVETRLGDDSDNVGTEIEILVGQVDATVDHDARDDESAAVG